MSSSTASKLDDLIGLRTAKNVIRRLALDDRGIHAILLYGPQGSGKTELANILTQLWLCREPSEEGADGTCRPCMAYARGNSPDVLLVEPQGKSNLIRIDAITESKETKAGSDELPLLTFLRTQPLQARHKVAIILEAHRMNNRSSNALLKTLEEPHSHAKLILTTDAVGTILPTILSRCLAVACEAPSQDEIVSAFPDATADEIRLAEGVPGRVRTVMARRALYERLVKFARRLPKRTPSEALVASEEFQSILEGFQSIHDGGVRAANAEALDALAIFFAREPSCPSSWTQKIIEAHRRIVGNGAASLILDALFTGLLTR